MRPQTYGTKVLTVRVPSGDWRHAPAVGERHAQLGVEPQPAGMGKHWKVPAKLATPPSSDEQYSVSRLQYVHPHRKVPLGAAHAAALLTSIPA